MTPHEKIGNLLTSLSKPVRVQIIIAIGTGEVCVCHLVSMLGLRQAYISQQLMVLREKQIISSRREGKYVYYRLKKPDVLDIIREVGEIVGVSKDSLLIQGHSNCECPKCSVEEKIITTALRANGKT